MIHQLEAWVKTICKRDENDDSLFLLPSGLLHELRESLFLGKDESDSRLRLVLKRYDSLKELTSGKPSLFWQDEDEQGCCTGFLDALDVAREFWNEFDVNDGGAQ